MSPAARELLNGCAWSAFVALGSAACVLATSDAQIERPALLLAGLAMFAVANTHYLLFAWARGHHLGRANLPMTRKPNDA